MRPNACAISDEQIARVGSPDPNDKQPPPPAHRHRRRRHEVAQQVGDVLHVVALAEALHHEVDQPRPVLRRQPVRPADPRVVELVLRQRRRDAALPEVDLDQAQRLAVRRDPAERVADVERRVRPGRLGQVLDRHRDPAVALDEQHVARLQHPPERRDVGVGEGLRRPATARRACGRGSGPADPPRCPAPPSSHPLTPAAPPLTPRRRPRSHPAPEPARRHLPRRPVAFDATTGAA